MIVRPPLHWLRMLFAWHGSVLPGLLPRLTSIFLLALGALWVDWHVPGRALPLNPQPFSLVGISLAVFLAFRNNAAYDRYWEARKLWGQLLNVARSLTRQAITLPAHACGRESAQAFCGLLAGFTHALRHQLRATDPAADLRRVLPAALADRVLASKERPAVLIPEIGNWVTAQARAGQLDGFGVLAFEHNLNALSDVLGGCERIAGTPLPFAYSVMIHRTVYVFCGLLPFGLAGTIGIFTPLFAVFVAYTFMAIEAIAAELEEPFGTEQNDLPLDAMCYSIENAMHAMLGDGMQVAAPPGEHYIVL